MKLSLRIALAVGVLALVAIAAAPFLYPRIETARLWDDVIGVDVSNHQGNIDWKALADDDISFAYIKASEGGDFRDARFQQNWDGAKAADIPRGAYHFFTQCRPGREQAQNFIAVVPRDSSALPPVVDAEHMGPCRQGPAMPDIVAELTEFIAIVEAHYGKRPILYITPEFDAAYLAGRFETERFWVRSILVPPSVRKDSWIIWQYHNMGRRNGVVGPVDLNAFRGSKKELAALIN